MKISPRRRWSNALSYSAAAGLYGAGARRGLRSLAGSANVGNSGTPYGGSSMKWLREESGQVLVMTFFSMGILLGALGLAVDVGVLLHARRNMQAAADAAAMAGATEMFYNGSTNVAAKAKAAAKGMGVDSTVTGNIVNVTVSPTLTGGVACPTCVQVSLATPNPTLFIAAMSKWAFSSTNFNSINVSANAVAGSPGASQTCVYIMDPTDASTLWIHGAGDYQCAELRRLCQLQQPQRILRYRKRGKVQLRPGCCSWRSGQQRQLQRRSRAPCVHEHRRPEPSCRVAERTD